MSTPLEPDAVTEAAITRAGTVEDLTAATEHDDIGYLDGYDYE